MRIVGSNGSEEQEQGPIVERFNAATNFLPFSSAVQGWRLGRERIWRLLFEGFLCLNCRIVLMT